MVIPTLQDGRDIGAGGGEVRGLMDHGDDSAKEAMVVLEDEVWGNVSE